MIVLDAPLVVAVQPLVATVRRRRVIEVLPDGEIDLTGLGAGVVTLRLLDKSGRRARFVLELPDEVRVDQRK